MFSQTSLTNRRKFLEHSALGAGSVLFLSGLLASCTDHRIPDPKTPLSGNGGPDWNNDAKKAVTTGLKLVPGYGVILSGLVGAIWPTPEDTPWNQIKDQVDQLINQKLDTLVFNVASGKLDNLRKNMQDYLQKLKDGSLTERDTYWGIVKEAFITSQSSFTVAGYEVMLLPLYTQYTNLYLSLLRDPLIPTRNTDGSLILGPDGKMVLTGTTWGMTDKDISDTKTNLQDYIKEAGDWASKWYDAGRANVIKIRRDDEKVEPFRSTNAYDRQMTMLVLDYMDTWKYYDITKYPKGAVNLDGTPIYLFTREIYSDPYGNILKVSSTPPPFALPTPATQFPTLVTVWGGSRIDAVQLTYPAGGGPGGVTQTARMGDPKGGTTESPHGGTFDMRPNSSCIQDVSVTYSYPPGTNLSYVINTLQFAFSYPPGSFVKIGGTEGQFKGDSAYANYGLSSIYINGVSEHYGDSADCIVFGFMRWPRA